MQLPISSITMQRFTCVLASKLFIAEASDLHGENLLQALYDDACDVGFGLYTPHTHALSRWFWSREEKSVENEVLVTIYKPCTESVRKYPKLEGWEMHILND